jgi:AraC-like DNA-binding protein
MDNCQHVQKQLLAALQHQIIPWLSERSSLRLLLAEPPVVAPPGVRILGYRPPLPEVPLLKPPSLHQYIWPKQLMNTARHIGIACVLQGEADFVLGTNIERIPEGADDHQENDLEVITIPQQTLFLIPAGVPRPNGTGPHWERPGIEQAYSRIFWVLTLPTAAFCHICETRGKLHLSDGVLTVEDDQLEPLARAIQEELSARLPKYDSVVQSLALALMLRLERALCQQSVLPGRQRLYAPLPVPNAGLFVKSICQYIQMHRNEPLTLPEIANRHHVSPSQLNRRLQAEIGMSAIQYLVHTRIEAAKELLMDADLAGVAMQQISNLVGFSEVSYFRRVFTRRVGATPSEFRERYARNRMGAPAEDASEE